jgi:hypothetical protein
MGYNGTIRGSDLPRHLLRWGSVMRAASTWSRDRAHIAVGFEELRRLTINHVPESAHETNTGEPSGSLMIVVC